LSWLEEIATLGGGIGGGIGAGAVLVEAKPVLKTEAP